MAGLISWWRSFQKTLWGELLTALVYAVMLALVLIFFTGEGQFIYEMF